MVLKHLTGKMNNVILEDLPFAKEIFLDHNILQMKSVQERHSNLPSNTHTHTHTHTHIIDN